MNQSQFQLATGVSGELAARWFVHIEKAMQQYGIANQLDKAMFLPRWEQNPVVIRGWWKT
jgi:putative chitinase